MGIISNDVFKKDEIPEVVEDEDIKLKKLYSERPESCPHKWQPKRERSMVDRSRKIPYYAICKYCGIQKKVCKGDPEWED